MNDENTPTRLGGAAQMSTDTGVRSVPPAVASPWHTLGLLLIFGVPIFSGIHAQRAGGFGAGRGPEGQFPDAAILFYLIGIASTWVLFGYCALGVRGRGIWALAGGRWTSWKSVGTDLAIMVPFWLILMGANVGVMWLLGAGRARSSLDSLLPHSALEFVLWICLCATVGICEEVIFRGYLQRQLHALSGNLGVAIVAQAVLFGLGHPYQGWSSVFATGVMGLLFGALAAWRRNLRINMLSHTWHNVFVGWLGFVGLR
jgi:membrane protease YdiL (CAAX protease family)